MELSQFVKESLLSITQGITSANLSLEDAPFNLGNGEKGIIEFDISVMVEEGKSKEIGGSAALGFASILTVSGGAKTSKTIKDFQTHRIKFSINVHGKSFFKINTNTEKDR